MGKIHSKIKGINKTNTIKGGRGTTKGNSSQKTPPKEYNILALGDSVMWGQGVGENENYVALTAKYIKEKFNYDTIRTSMLAHSGAVIGDESISNNHFYFGELPRQEPDLYSQFNISKYGRLSGEEKENIDNILNPLSDRDSVIQKDTKALLRKQLKGLRNKDPDLIFINGGANDYGLKNIALGIEDKNTSDDSIWESIIDKIDGTKNIDGAAAIYARRNMKILLEEVSNYFPNSKIIVTGYYNVVTKGSLKNDNWKNLVNLLWYILHITSLLKGGKGFIKLKKVKIKLLIWIVKNKLIKNVDTWFKSTNKYFKEGIDEVNQNNGNKNIYYVSPIFGENNGIFAKNSLVFGAKEETFDIEKYGFGKIEVMDGDIRKKDRREAYDILERETGNKKDKLATYFASIAHPNQSGHKKYFTAIKKIIDNNL